MSTRLEQKLKSHGVTIYAVAKAGGWSWQQVAEWVKGRRVPQIKTYCQLHAVMLQEFDITISINDFKKGGKE